jgi:hypothetical protein
MECRRHHFYPPARYVPLLLPFVCPYVYHECVQSTTYVLGILRGGGGDHGGHDQRGGGYETQYATQEEP